MVRAVGIEPTLLAERDFEWDETTDSNLAFPRPDFRENFRSMESRHFSYKLCKDLCKSLPNLTAGAACLSVNSSDGSIPFEIPFASMTGLHLSFRRTSRRFHDGQPASLGKVGTTVQWSIPTKSGTSLFIIKVNRCAG
jgi:hypothetical protein